jgi:hypothetical protein
MHNYNILITKEILKDSILAPDQCFFFFNFHLVNLKNKILESDSWWLLSIKFLKNESNSIRFLSIVATSATGLPYVCQLIN